MAIEHLKCGHCESRIEFLIELNYNLHSPMWLMSPHWTVVALENKILLNQEFKAFLKIVHYYSLVGFAGFQRWDVYQCLPTYQKLHIKIRYGAYI